MRSIAIPLLILSLSIASPISTRAHETGASLEGIEGEYLIDIGYSPEQLIEGESAVFDFSLQNEGVNAEFDSVWVRLSSGEKTVLATGIGKSEFGKTVLTYTFPDQGAYEMSVRFQEGDRVLAERVFPLSVGAGEGQAQPGVASVAGGALLGALCGGALMFFVVRKKK